MSPVERIAEDRATGGIGGGAPSPPDVGRSESGASRKSEKVNVYHEKYSLSRADSTGQIFG